MNQRMFLRTFGRYQKDTDRRLATVEAGVTNVEGDLGRLKGTVEKQAVEMGKLKATVETQEEDMGKLKGGVEKLEGEMAQLKGVQLELENLKNLFFGSSKQL